MFHINLTRVKDVVDRLSYIADNSGKYKGMPLQKMTIKKSDMNNLDVQRQIVRIADRLKKCDKYMFSEYDGDNVSFIARKITDREKEVNNLAR